jgi:hypothetical protein
MFAYSALSLMVFAIMTAAQGQPESRFDAQKAITTIRAAAASRDLKRLQEVADSVRSALPLSSRECLKVLSETCTALASVNFGVSGQSEMLQKLATATVRDGMGGPVEELAAVVRHVQIDFGRNKRATDIDEWERSRLTNLRLYLTVWQRLSSAIDRTFDFSKRPQKNLSPPGGNYSAGISPESIREPEIRKAYEAALEENRKRFISYNRELALRESEKSLIRSLELGTVRAYSIEPVSIEEVEREFKQFDVPPEVTASVVKQLEARALTLRDVRDKLKEKRDASPPKIQGEDAVARGKSLRDDPRLQVKISGTYQKPTIPDMLARLQAATGVTMVCDMGSDADKPAFMSLSMNQSFVWVVMERLAKSEIVQGHWETEGDGYRLVRTIVSGGTNTTVVILCWLLAGVALLGLIFAGNRYVKHRSPPSTGGAAKK